MLSQERLKELVSYNPDTGTLYWNTARKGVAKGLAGCTRKGGYSVIRIDGALYLSHRIIFFLVKDEWPVEFIDHINGDKSDNRWNNLRCASPSENGCNRLLTSQGVYEIVRKGRPGVWFSPVIEKDGRKYSSTFRKKEDAIEWRKNKERELFGEFRREAVL